MSYELLGIYLQWVAEVVRRSVCHEYARVWGVGEQQEPTVGVLSEEILMTWYGFESAALEVGEALVGIKESCRPYLIGIIFLNAQDVLLVVVVEVEGRGIEITVAQDDENDIIGMKLAEALSVIVIVETSHIPVKPYLASSEGAGAMTLETDTFHIKFREQVTHAGTTLDHDFAEVLVQRQALELGHRLECDLDDFCLAVGVGGEVGHATAGLALREVVLAVAGDRRHVETLDIEGPSPAITIDTIVYGTRVALLEDGDMYDLAFALLGLRALRLADKHLFPDANHLVRPVLVEDDDVVDVRTVADELVLLQPRAQEALLAVDVELLIGLHHLGGLDAVKAAYLCLTRMLFTVFFLYEAKPVGCDLGDIGKVTVDAGNLLLHTGDGLFCLFLTETCDALHLDFQQTQDIVLRHFTHKLRVEGRQALIDVVAQLVRRVSVLKGLALIDALLNEYLF